MFEPVTVEGRWLFDGAIVNPVPVSVARALGAERVIAFNISSEIVGRGTAIQDPFGRPEPPPRRRRAARTTEAASSAAGGAAGAARAPAETEAAPPGLMTVMVNAFDILQDRIMRSRLAGDPPDALVQVKVGKIGMFEFHRADELIRNRPRGGPQGRRRDRRRISSSRRIESAGGLAPWGPHQAVVIYSRSACRSLSIMLTWRLTTSPIDTMPMSRPSSTTGRWRNRPAVIVSMT